jgi:hypothetical protein
MDMEGNSYVELRVALTYECSNIYIYT